MKLLKVLISFVVGTIASVLASNVFGAFGAVLGFIVGGVAAWWGAKRVLGE